MQNLFLLATKNNLHDSLLTNQEKLAVCYHDLFDYPLTLAELIKWQPSQKIPFEKEINVSTKGGYYHVDSREGLIYKRILRKRISAKKMLIAKKAAKVLSYVLTIKLIALTGSLAMQNSSEDGDIDLMIVTKSNSLWTTRIFAYLVLSICHLPFRRPFDKKQKDRLCLNMWLDENDLAWKKSDRNLYTAHEIAQIVPLVNKNKTYEKFLQINKWILDFWPNSVKIGKWKINGKWKLGNGKSSLLEKFCYRIQYNHMKSKMTREVVSLTRALFHPQDWGKVVINRLTT